MRMEQMGVKCNLSCPSCPFTTGRGSVFRESKNRTGFPTLFAGEESFICSAKASECDHCIKRVYTTYKKAASFATPQVTDKTHICNGRMWISRTTGGEVHPHVRTGHFQGWAGVRLEVVSCVLFLRTSVVSRIVVHRQLVSGARGLEEKCRCVLSMNINSRCCYKERKRK